MRLRRGHAHRTWPQRGLLAFNSLAVVVALATAAVLTYAKVRVDQVPRVELTSDGFKSARDLSHDAPRNFLVVGADDATTMDPNAPERAGRGGVTGIRSDTIMVVRLEPSTGQARILSFPRDLYVNLPNGGHGRINAALEYGGQNALVDTLQNNFGIEINNYLQIDFAGFKKLVDEVDGVPIYFDSPVGDGSSEGSSGLNVTTPGCTNLNGTGALQYVRARHFFRIIDGQRVYDGSSDLGRIKRQQDFIQRLMRRVINQGGRNPARLARYLNIATGNITLDQGTTPRDLIDLGAAFRNFDPAKLETFTIPANGTYKGGAAVLEIDAAAAAPLLAQFRTPAIGQYAGALGVAVSVSNGTGQLDQGAAIAKTLGERGFTATVAADTPAVARTEVRYPSRLSAQAAVVASFLDADPKLVEVPTATSVEVVTGPDLHGVLASPKTVGAAPTTTAATTTTTAPPSTSSTTPSKTVKAATQEYVPGAPPTGVSCS